MRRFLGIIALVVSVAGCGRGSGEIKFGFDDIRGLVDVVNHAEREFTYVMLLGGDTLEMTGRVKDDYRYQAVVRVNGSEVYEERVIDDARYLRVTDPAAISPEFASIHPTLEGLTRGWILDPNGAPPEFSPKDSGQPVPLDPRFVLDRVRFLEALPEILKREFEEWNTDALTYLPSEDKFPPHEEDGLRFDSKPLAYDPDASTVQLPQVAQFFEFISIWGKKSKGITRYESWLELPDPTDELYAELYRQLKQAGSRGLNDLIALGKEGRLMREAYTFKRAPVAAIERPPEIVGAADLSEALNALRQQLLREGRGAVTGPLVGFPS